MAAFLGRVRPQDSSRARTARRHPRAPAGTGGGDMDPIIRIFAGARFHRSAILLAGLALFIFVDPLINAPVAQLTLELAMLALLVLAVWALRVRGLKLVA